MLIPAHFVDIPMQSKCGLVEPTYEFCEKYDDLFMAKGVVNTESENVVIRILNPGDDIQRIYKNMIIATCEPILESDIIPLPDNQTNQTVHCNSVKTNIDTNAKHDNSESMPEYLQELFNESSENLDASQKSKLRQMLLKHDNVFARHKYDLGYTDIVEHKIDVGNAKPIKQAPRRLPIHQREIERKQVREMLEHGIIEEANSPWASNCVLVKKKSKDPNKIEYRYCCDFRRVNDLVTPEAIAMPRIDETLDCLSGAKYFSTLDLQAGYWQMGIEPESRPITAINTSR